MKKIKCADDVVKRALFKKGLKEEFVCKKLGIALNDFSAFMLGKRKLNSAEFIAICVFLNLSLEDFKECYKCL